MAEPIIGQAGRERNNTRIFVRENIYCQNIERTYVFDIERLRERGANLLVRAAQGVEYRHRATAEPGAGQKPGNPGRFGLIGGQGEDFPAGMEVRQNELDGASMQR